MSGIMVCAVRLLAADRLAILLQYRAFDEAIELFQAETSVDCKQVIRHKSRYICRPHPEICVLTVECVLTCKLTYMLHVQFITDCQALQSFSQRNLDGSQASPMVLATASPEPAPTPDTETFDDLPELEPVPQ
jgi:hypothetical protein